MLRTALPLSAELHWLFDNWIFWKARRGSGSAIAWAFPLNRNGAFSWIVVQLSAEPSNTIQLECHVRFRRNFNQVSAETLRTFPLNRKTDFGRNAVNETVETCGAFQLNRAATRGITTETQVVLQRPRNSGLRRCRNACIASERSSECRNAEFHKAT